MHDLFDFGVQKCAVRPVFPHVVHDLKKSDSRFPGKSFKATITAHADASFTYEARNAEGRVMWHGNGTNLDALKIRVDNLSRVYFGRLESGLMYEEERRAKRPNVKTDAGLAALKALAIDLSAGSPSNSSEETLAESAHSLINEVRELRRRVRIKEHDEKIYVQRTAQMMFLNKDKANTVAEWDNMATAVREKWKVAAAKFLGISYVPAPAAAVEDRFLP